MLLQLDIYNVALMDEVHIELCQGLNILTGETGAGKSIIIDSINAVLGERISREIIRTGTDRAMVEAVFEVENERLRDIFNEMGLEPEEDNTVILSRELTQSGRNICRINGKMVAASLLKAAGEQLIDLHGQHDNQSLLKTEKHIELLDSFGGNDISTLRCEYTSRLEEYREIRSKLKSLSGDPGERERKADLLKYQIDEIKKAKLKTNEEEELNRQRILLANAGKISEALSTAYGLLSSAEQGGRPASDALNEALSELNSISRLEEGYSDIQKRLQDVLYQVEDISEDIRKSIDNLECDPALLDEIEERLDLIYKLKRKYGETIPDILQFCSDSEKQLEELQKSEETAALLQKQLSDSELKLLDTAKKLDAERHKAARILEERIGVQLDDLEMKKARFKVDIQFENPEDSKGARKYGPNGLDRVEFLISANAGEPLKPLAKIASGGEMSRIMLAIKTILAEVDNIPSMIFDEIDIGISGKAAQKVGEKMSYISAKHQVICVTHLAQIACMADRHFLIEKFAGEDSTRTVISKLQGQDITKEISRMIGGLPSSETSLKYAGELLNNAEKLKKA